MCALCGRGAHPDTCEVAYDGLAGEQHDVQHEDEGSTIIITVHTPGVRVTAVTVVKTDTVRVLAGRVSDSLGENASFVPKRTEMKLFDRHDVLLRGDEEVGNTDVWHSKRGNAWLLRCGTWAPWETDTGVSASHATPAGAGVRFPSDSHQTSPLSGPGTGGDNERAFAKNAEDLSRGHFYENEVRGLPGWNEPAGAGGQRHGL